MYIVRQESCRTVLLSQKCLYNVAVLWMLLRGSMHAALHNFILLVACQEYESYGYSQSSISGGI